MRTAQRSPSSILVLGIGNVLLRDEGAGVHALHALQAAVGDADGALHYVDGGTVGLALAQQVGTADALLVFDAARLDDDAGSVALFEGDAMDAFVCRAHWRSVHEAGLQDLLAAAALLGELPARRALIGIAPAEIDWGDAPSAPVAAALPRAVALAQHLLARWQAQQAMPASADASDPWHVRPAAQTTARSVAQDVVA